MEEDLKKMGGTNWRRKSQDRDQRRAIVRERPRFMMDCSASSGGAGGGGGGAAVTVLVGA